jgi:large subunit ribosomal protein L24
VRRRGWLSANRPPGPAPKSVVRKGDTVVIIAGKDRGKSGKVLSVRLQDRKVTVEKINIIKRHTKPNQQNRQGGILEREAPIHLSNVMVYCATCQKPVRVGSKTLPDGSRARVCKKCSQHIEAPERK